MILVFKLVFVKVFIKLKVQVHRLRILETKTAKEENATTKATSSDENVDGNTNNFENG